MDKQRTIPVTCQFTYGTLVDRAGVHSGYTLTAVSPNAEKDLLKQVIEQTDIGQPLHLGRFAQAFGVFHLESQVIFVRYERHPILDRGREVLQSHYLLINSSDYAEIGNKFWYVLPRLPKIPARSAQELLPEDKITITLDRNQEISTVIRYLKQAPQLILGMLPVLFSPFPIVIMQDRDNLQLTLELLEAIALLIPPSLRSELSFATETFNARETKTKIRAINGGSQGVTNLPPKYVSVQPESKVVTPPDMVPIASTYADLLSYSMQSDTLKDVGKLLDVIDLLQVSPTTVWERADSESAQEFWRVAGAHVLVWEIKARRGSLDRVCGYLRLYGKDLDADYASYLLGFAVRAELGTDQKILDFVPDVLVGAHTDRVVSDLGSLLISEVKAGSWQHVFDQIERWGVNSAFLSSAHCLKMATDVLNAGLDLMTDKQILHGLKLIRRWLDQGLILREPSHLIRLLTTLIKDSGYPVAQVWNSLLDLAIDQETLVSFLNDAFLSELFFQAPSASQLLVAVANHERIRTKLILDAFASLGLPTISFHISLVKLGLRLGEMSLLNPWVCSKLVDSITQSKPETDDTEISHLLRAAVSPATLTKLPDAARPMVALLALASGDDLPYQSLVVDSLSGERYGSLEALLSVVEAARQESGLGADLYESLFGGTLYRYLPQESQRSLSLTILRKLQKQGSYPCLLAVANLLEAPSLKDKWTDADLDFIMTSAGRVRYELGFTSAIKTMLPRVAAMSDMDKAIGLFERIRGEVWTYYGQGRAEEQYAILFRDSLVNWWPSNLVHTAKMIRFLQAEDFTLEAQLIQERLVSFVHSNPEILAEYLTIRIEELRSLVDFFANVDRNLLSDLTSHDEYVANAIAILKRLAEKSPLGSSRLEQLGRDLGSGRENR